MNQITFTQAIAVVNRAMDKIRDEMAAAKDDYISIIGEMMTEYLQANPSVAEAILTEGKTLAGAYGAMHEEARKNRNGRSCVCIPPEKAKEIILGYYGLKPAAPVSVAPPVPRDDDLDLDALLGV